MADALEARGSISLLLADVDGTLVTEDKVLTERARAAVHRLHEAGIGFAITSGRPPRGMAMLIEPLALETPIAAFNGGIFVAPDMTIIEQHVLAADVARRAVELICRHGMDVWVYSGSDWLIHNPAAPHVAREQWTVRFAPTVLEDFGQALDRAVKIVGVSDDHDLVARCEEDAQATLGARPRRRGRSLTTSTSPTSTPTRERWSPRSPSSCPSPSPRSPRSATCRTTS
jgi:hydroxymethylpyrimidine pyrophosphatase-like HAD family hydrolase